MDFLTDWLTDWLKELLISGIMGNLEGLTDYCQCPGRRDRGTGGDDPGGMERRGFLPHTPAFRNGDFTDCRDGADFRCHL